MASTIQIVPKYSFPHVATYIYDNTEVTDVPSTQSDDSFKTIHVFRGGRGIDNKVVKKRTTDDIKNTFGKTDYKKYGQPLMMPYATVSSEYASAYCMRIMPLDATYANSMLYAYYRTGTAVVDELVYDENGELTYKEDGITPETTQVSKPMFQVMFRSINESPEVDSKTNRIIANSTAGIRMPKQMNTVMAAGVEDIAATDGGSDWVCVPLMYFHSTGRGSYGNNYTWRVSRNSEYERDYSTKVYTFDVVETSSGTISAATYVGSLVSHTINNKSCCINDVITDYDPGDYPVEMYVYEETIDVLYDAYVNFLNDLAMNDPTLEIVVPDEKEFDIFFGTGMNSNETYEYYQVVNSDNSAYPIADDENAVDLGDTVGIPLNGGHDGAFATFIAEDGTQVDGATEVITKDMYINAVKSGIDYLTFGEATVEDYVYALAFNGLLDKAILSTRRVPADYMLDGGYSYFTKLSFAKFVDTRNDCLGYVDMGTDYETFSTSVLNDMKEKFGGIFKNRLFSLNPHYWKVSDPFTQRKVVVTPTYWIASALPIHWHNFGVYYPFAKSYARITGHTKNSIAPVVDLHEADLMEEMAQSRFNYVESYGENLYQRGIQNTAQVINSDLLEEHAVHVLMYLKRRIENDIFENLYDFADSSDRATFKTVEEAKYEFMRGSWLQSFEIDFKMNKWEHERQIIHCYLSIQFRTIAKRATVEIDVNPRDFDA